MRALQAVSAVSERTCTVLYRYSLLYSVCSETHTTARTARPRAARAGRAREVQKIKPNINKNAKRIVKE